MKKIISTLIITILCSSSFSLHAQVDTAIFNKLSVKVNTVSSKVDALAANVEVIDKAVSKIDTTKKCDCISYPKPEEIKGADIWLIFSPEILFLLFLVPLLLFVNSKGFKCEEALTENEPPKKTIKNPEYSAAAIAANAAVPNLSTLFPTTIEVSNVMPSWYELKAISKAKKETAEAIEKALKEAHNNQFILKAAIPATQIQLTTAQNAATGFAANVIAAQTSLANLRAANPPDSVLIVAGERTLADAKNAVVSNDEMIMKATAKLKEVPDNAKKIADLTTLLALSQEEAREAEDDFEIAKKAPQNNTTYSTNAFRPSISRYIAFITSLVTIILIVCMSSFFIYQYIRTGCPPEFGALTVVLIALGLGAMPYIANKISTASAANKS